MNSMLRKMVGKIVMAGALAYVFYGAMSADPIKLDVEKLLKLDVEKLRKEYAEKKDIGEKADVLEKFIKKLEACGLKWEIDIIANFFEKFPKNEHIALVQFSLEVACDFLKHKKEGKPVDKTREVCFDNFLFATLASASIFDDKTLKTLVGPNYSHIGLSALCGAGILAAGYYLWQKFFGKKETPEENTMKYQAEVAKESEVTAKQEESKCPSFSDDLDEDVGVVEEERAEKSEIDFDISPLSSSDELVEQDDANDAPLLGVSNEEVALLLDVSSEDREIADVGEPQEELEYRALSPSEALAEDVEEAREDFTRGEAIQS